MADNWIIAASRMAWWQARMLKVRNKFDASKPTGKLIPFKPSPQQLRMIHLAAKQLASGNPLQQILLKHRQGGWSTQSQGLLFADAYIRDHRACLTCAHKAESSETLFRIGTTFCDNIPREQLRPTDYSSRREIIWSEPHGSSYSVATAGSDDLGRGSMLTGLHASEVAWWPSQEQTWASVSQAWAASDPTAILIVESTANGWGDMFHALWSAAVERKRRRTNDFAGFEPLFFGWLDHIEYRKLLPKGYDLFPLTDREQALRILGADDTQLFWRRTTIEERLNGNEDLFAQEYPASPDEAFLLSGRSAIPPQVVTEHARTAQDGRTCRLGDSGFVDDPGGCWRVYCALDEACDYAIGADVAEGRLSDPADERSEPDYSTIVVLDRRNLVVVADYRARIDPDLFGGEMLKAAGYWNRAWMTPEINNAGWATLAKIKAWPRLMGRQSPEDQDRPMPLNSLGWRTTQANRDFLIDDWVAACRPDPMRGFDEKVSCLSRRIASEEAEFIYTKSGKREHRPGGHDDMLFAAMIAWQVHQRCPRSLPDALVPNFANARPSIAWAGAIDPGVWVGEDAGDWTS